MYRVEEVYGPDGQVYLALRPELPEAPKHYTDDRDVQEERVIIIDMFEDTFENVYEF